MLKICHKEDIENNSRLPIEVVQKVIKIVNILDNNYGKMRDVYVDAGGYVILLETREDIELTIKETGIDIINTIPEDVEIIKCSNGEEYINSLILCNNEFGINFIMPLRLATKGILEYLK